MLHAFSALPAARSAAFRRMHRRLNNTNNTNNINNKEEIKITILVCSMPVE
jgi:hypothetical protein